MKSYFTLLFLSIFFCHYVQYSACQQAKGPVSHDDKSPFEDCSVINELNEAKCKNKIGQLGHPKGSDHHGDVASGSNGGIISSQGGKVNNSGFVVTGHNGNGKENGIKGHHLTPEPKTNELFNCSHENFTHGSSFGNCTSENVTTHAAKTTETTATTALPTTTTTLPTTTVDLPALFSKLGISTEKPESTSTVKPLHHRDGNFTEFHNETHFNLTEVFNITMEFNMTEFILEEHPDLPDHILKEYADVEKASNHIFCSGSFSCRQGNSASGKGKPALVVFDRVKLAKCDKKPHPVTKLIYFLAESQIIVEFQNHICDCDYSDYCKTEWKDCKADGRKLCPKTCNLTKCADTRYYGYTAQDKPSFKVAKECENKKLYNCNFLKDRGDCFSAASSMEDICPDTCFTCSEDAKYLPWLPEYQKMILWLKRYKNGKYNKYAQVFLYEENVIHKKAKKNLC